MNEKITFVLTSCDRPDELRCTLKSFMAYNSDAISDYIVIEDSENLLIKSIVEELLPEHTKFIQNDHNIGNMDSVDKAYSHIKTPYIFHCEDDWLFPEYEVVSPCVDVLEDDSKISAVLTRDISEMPSMFSKHKKVTASNVVYYKTALYDHHTWGSFSFNPGLRRLSDYKESGNFVALGGEGNTSWEYKRRGFSLAALEKGGTVHIGEDNSAIHKRHGKSRMLARFKNSIYVRLRLWRHLLFNKNN